MISWPLIKRITLPHLKIFLNLGKRVLLLMLLTLLAAAGFTLVLQNNRSVDPFVMKITAILGVGLAAGFSARWLLRRNTQMLRLLAGAAVLLVVLVVQNLWSRGSFGISLFQGSLAGPDYDVLWQCALGCFAGWLPLQAWQKRSRRRRRKKTSARPPAARVEPIPAAPNAATQLAELRAPSALKLTHDAHSPDAKPVKMETPPRPRARLLKAHPARRKHSAVHLVGSEEHRCPYCLEPVETTDMSKVVICPVCSAYHHKDCWDITGTCQVPHNHE